MAAKPRVTVRLAPATLHALAYIAARDGLAPAEAARMMVGAQVESTLRKRGWVADHQEAWRAWLAEQAARGARAEVPDQADYDALAEGRAAPPAPAAAPHAAVPMARQTPLSVTIAESEALLARVGARLAARKARA